MRLDSPTRIFLFNSFLILFVSHCQGLIEYTKESIRLTEEGRTKANADVGAISCADNASAQDDIIKRFKIGGKAAVLVKSLFNGKIHDRETTIGSLGLKSKASAAIMLSNLKKHGVIAYDNTTVKATDICFPFGRRYDTE